MTRGKSFCISYKEGRKSSLPIVHTANSKRKSLKTLVTTDLWLCSCFCSNEEKLKYTVKGNKVAVML